MSNGRIDYRYEMLARLANRGQEIITIERPFNTLTTPMPLLPDGFHKEIMIGKTYNILYFERYHPKFKNQEVWLNLTISAFAWTNKRWQPKPEMIIIARNNADDITREYVIKDISDVKDVDGTGMIPSYCVSGV